MRAWAVAVALVVLAASGACGTQLHDSTPAPAATDGGDAEARVTTFTCGATTCAVGREACCADRCQPIDGGCAAVDGGGDAAVAPLTCTTYNNCASSDDQCCYSPATGSACMKGCPTGSVKLCTLNMDGCDDDYECFPMANAPQAEIGECLPK